MYIMLDSMYMTMSITTWL